VRGGLRAAFDPNPARVSGIRYVHFDNDYFPRGGNSPIEVSDHDPPVATIKLPRRIGD
jgi:hypothetical protein